MLWVSRGYRWLCMSAFMGSTWTSMSRCACLVLSELGQWLFTHCRVFLACYWVGCRGQASCLMERYPRVRVIVDVFELTSMKFLNQRFFDWKLPPVLWPPYTSGAVFCSSMLDTVLCQVRAVVLRNISLINLLERRAFVFGEWKGVRRECD